MKREWVALGAAVAASVLVLAGTAIVAQVLRHQAQAVSHEQPSTESWFTPAPVRTPEMVALGRKLFLNSCAHCHGVDATGDEGPDLHNLQISDRHIVNVIKNGIKDEMPSFAKKHNDAEITDLQAYIRSLQ